MNAYAGIIEIMDNIMSKSSDLQVSVLDEVIDAAQGIADQYASYYAKIAGKMKASRNFAGSELKRLEALQSKRGLAAIKQDDIVRRSNILRKFAKALPSGKDEL